MADSTVHAELTTDQFDFDPFSENEAHNPIQIPVAAQAPVEVDANDDADQSCRYYALRQGRYTKCCIYVSEQDLLPQIDGFEDGCGVYGV